MTSKYLTLLLSVLLLAMVKSAWAERVWVVGSFVDQSRAEAAAESLSDKTGLEVSLQTIALGDKNTHRLIVFPVADALTTRNQLTTAGIVDPWQITLSRDQVTEPASRSPDVAVADQYLTEATDLSSQRRRQDETSSARNEMNDYSFDEFGEAIGDFLVIASFADAEPAYALQRELMDDFPEVLIKEAVSGADYYHRVLVGPIDTTDNIYGRLAELGYHKPWPLRDVSYLPISIGAADPRRFADNSDASLEAPSVAPTRRRYSPPPDPTQLDVNGYNPARLEGRYEIEPPRKKGMFNW